MYTRVKPTGAGGRDVSRRRGARKDFFIPPPRPAGTPGCRCPGHGREPAPPSCSPRDHPAQAATVGTGGGTSPNLLPAPPHPPAGPRQRGCPGEPQPRGRPVTPGGCPGTEASNPPPPPHHHHPAAFASLGHSPNLAAPLPPALLGSTGSPVHGGVIHTAPGTMEIQGRAPTATP